ncbi:MAG TPA: hypothetical protein VLJ59_15010 [Mycobacteriales bacterium]|nr:hypothetical protein [Mycobacteriales bacterium]
MPTAAPSATPGRGVLVLGFDGVICDTWQEHAVLAWGAYHGWPPDAGPHPLDAVPADVIAIVRTLRGFVRHLGHLRVPLMPGADAVRTQEDFDRTYAQLAPDDVTDFTRRAAQFRAEIRTGRWPAWLALHRMYDGLHGVLSAYGGRLYVVTARDRGSVCALLGEYGVGVAPDRVYGDQESKDTALAHVQTRECVAADRLWFVDDNLGNVLAARSAGHRAVWALWGYSAPEHSAQAARLGVVTLALPDLPALAAEVAGLVC